jgi:uncharacterized protein (TIGR00369 family)
MGTLHGGIYCDLADAAMGYAYAARMPEGETFTTVELKINFFRPVRQGRLTAEARVVKAVSTLGYVECDVKDDAGKHLHEATSGPPANGKGGTTMTNPRRWIIPGSASSATNASAPPLRPVAGKWSTLELVCHIADCEQFFASRIKRS